MYKNYGRNMRSWKPTREEDETVLAYPCVVVIYREEAKRVREVIKGDADTNKKIIKALAEKLTKNVPESQFVLTVMYFESEKDWEKILQLGKLKKRRK